MSVLAKRSTVQSAGVCRDLFRYWSWLTRRTRAAPASSFSACRGSTRLPTTAASPRRKAPPPTGGLTTCTPTGLLLLLLLLLHLLLLLLILLLLVFLPATYRTAYSKAHIDMVDIFGFNKNYNNFWDPTVLKAYVTKIRKTWKSAYGFPYTYPVPWNGTKTSTIDSTKCHLKCFALVSCESTKASKTSLMLGEK